MTARFGAPLLAKSGHAHPTWEDFGPIEWITLVLASVVAIWVIWKAVMYTLRPGETSEDHIKRQILREPGTFAGSLSSDAPHEDAR